MDGDLCYLRTPLRHSRGGDQGSIATTSTRPGKAQGRLLRRFDIVLHLDPVVGREVTNPEFASLFVCDGQHPNGRYVV